MDNKLHDCDLPINLDNSNDKKYSAYLDEVSSHKLSSEQKDEVIKFLKTLAVASIQGHFNEDKENE